MRRTISETDYRREFIDRTAQARVEGNFTQAQIATLLDIPQDRYKQYETRSVLPHYFVPMFCLATKCSPAWLFGLKVDASKKPSSPSERAEIKAPDLAQTVRKRRTGKERGSHP